MEIAGLPLHPLIVHAVVVFAPLAALLAIGYAVLPRWRWALRGVLVGTTILAVGSGALAATSGGALLDAREALKAIPAVGEHVDIGGRQRNVLLGFGVVALAAAWRLGGSSGLVSGRGARPEHGGPGDRILQVLLVLAAVAVLVLTIQAGHSGAKAVWG